RVAVRQMFENGIDVHGGAHLLSFLKILHHEAHEGHEDSRSIFTVLPEIEMDSPAPGYFFFALFVLFVLFVVISPLFVISVSTLQVLVPVP
ncbi:MAG: hypothetical protein ACYC1F_06125, partial [Gallionellaceae bacterium]